MKRTITCFAVAFLLAGCGNGSKNYELPDVTKPDTVTLIKNPRQTAIHSLTVTGAGKIDGDAVIVLMLNGGPYKTETLSGTVNFKWEGDWYSDQAEIRYTPTSVKGGKLRLRYRFN